MEQNNREDYEIYNFNFGIDVDTVKNCIEDLNVYNINDKDSYYMTQVIYRLDKCNALSLKEFDDELEKLINSLDTCELIDMSKFIRLSTNLYVDVFKIYTKIFKKLLDTN